MGGWRSAFDVLPVLRSNLNVRAASTRRAKTPLSKPEAPRNRQLDNLLTSLDGLIAGWKMEETGATNPKIVKDPCKRVPFDERKHGALGQPPAVSIRDPVRRKLEKPRREDDEQSQISASADSGVGDLNQVLAQLG